MAKKRGRKKGQRGPGRGKQGPIYNKKKAGKGRGQVPLDILEKRLVKLNRIVAKRQGFPIS